MDVINSFIANPAYREYLAIVKGARNGLVYGAKIRFPHALVMTLLFHRGGMKAKTNFVYEATKQHALNLAKFVTIYKTLMLIQRKMNGGKERSLDTFLSGLMGGYIVFGERNAVNEQIVLYVSSRVLASYLPRIYQAPSHPIETAAPATIKPIPPASLPFSLFASVAWGLVMYIFRHNGENLQAGMVNSMTYLYRDSDTWSDLRSLLWHNK